MFFIIYQSTSKLITLKDLVRRQALLPKTSALKNNQGSLFNFFLIAFESSVGASQTITFFKRCLNHVIY